MTNEIERAGEITADSDEQAKKAVLEACEKLETLRIARVALENLMQELAPHEND